MDGLFIKECINLDFVFCNIGVMYVCGYDIYIIVGLGIVMVLFELGEFLLGDVCFLF